MYPINMKLILQRLFLVTFCIFAGCLSITSEIQRTPSSIKKPVDSVKATSELYLKYQLIKNSNFEKISIFDCKAFAQLNPMSCDTDDCRAILNEQDNRCKEGTCKAFINRREEQCSDNICKALIRNDSEMCGTDRICRSLVDEESQKCDGNPDCKGMVDKSGGVCKSGQCKAIVYENFTFCEAKPTTP